MSELSRGHRLHAANWLDVSEALLERLRGRLNLIQSGDDRQRITLAVLDELCKDARNGVAAKLATDDARRDFLSHFLSYDVIEEFLRDPEVEDIMINSTDPIFVHKTNQGLVKTDRRFPTTRELFLLVNKLLVFGGRTELETINDLELTDIRGRVNIALSPFGPQITITRAKERPLSILHLIKNGALPYELAGQLWFYVEGLGIKPANIIIAGGPGSGKTTLLNAMLSFVPTNERVVVIEDTLELNTQFLENCSRLESTASVTMATLVKNALRMRPDRVIVGEVRGAEARDLMTAVNIGKYCMGTLHASTARETVIRLQNEPMNIPEILVNLVDVFIVLRRFNVGGKVWRAISDVVETAGLEQRVVLLSHTWSYDYERRKHIEASPSSVYRDRISLATGRTPLQIMEEVARRTRILQLMAEKNPDMDTGEVTRLCQLYISDPKQAADELGTTLEALELVPPGRGAGRARS